MVGMVNCSRFYFSANSICYHIKKYDVSGQFMKDRYRDFPFIATIIITNFSTKEEYVKARELINARTAWVHNQKNDWDKHGRRRYYTLNSSQSDKITVIFGYEEGFDVNMFANEIINVADLYFLDFYNNQIINSDEIVTAHYAYQGATQAYDVIVKVTENGMKNYLAAIEGKEDKRNYTQVNFEGSIPSDNLSVIAKDNETLIIKGFININAAESLVKLIKLKDAPKDLNVELKIE
jgi:hypothetical protein